MQRADSELAREIGRDILLAGVTATGRCPTATGRVVRDREATNVRVGREIVRGVPIVAVLTNIVCHAVNIDAPFVGSAKSRAIHTSLIASRAEIAADNPSA